MSSVRFFPAATVDIARLLLGAVVIGKLLGAGCNYSTSYRSNELMKRQAEEMSEFRVAQALALEQDKARTDALFQGAMIGLADAVLNTYLKSHPEEAFSIDRDAFRKTYLENAETRRRER